jgi:hypothetical protein
MILDAIENYLALHGAARRRMNLARYLCVRYAMQCHVCNKPLAERAPIYRLPLSSGSRPYISRVRTCE